MMLEENELEALQRLAKKERRTPKLQAAKLVADGLLVAKNSQRDDKDTKGLNNAIRGWVSDGCPPTTLFRDGDFYYVSAHTDKGLNGGKVTDLRFDEWGEHTPQSDADADWIATQITEKIEAMTTS